MFEEIPFMIQHGERRDTDHLPLVLIHDGGGTCFSYYLLGLLDRPVFGINNPRLRSMRPWRGGLPEMAAVYCELLLDIEAPNGFILGGWSFGGLVALEMAAMLARHRHVKVAGIVMIDTPYPLSSGDFKLSPFIVSLKENCRPEVRMAVQKSFFHTRKMAENWSPPLFLDSAGDIHTSKEPNQNATAVQDRLRSPASSAILKSGMPVALRDGNLLPPSVLIRATSKVPMKSVEERAVVDGYRDEQDLGWQRYLQGFPLSVVDIPGCHFSIFNGENLLGTTEAIRAACSAIENAQRLKHEKVYS
ncbi:Alpha/Beta hydrolase protein [Pseudomassariella vexata]|uniref:Alpha/Beta hydrolase protein n=1 Tax=Pseudomassariella vexata TaxID=1141098 RepID=A0A1Y2DIU2_9PEZI|nr:Alpha/Beta hydrolase protein [Pseudomassariella vexata]ORY58745.1 Alpha/Beta hydrolase protein [Pseudomassariella vexata]